MPCAKSSIVAVAALCLASCGAGNDEPMQNSFDAIGPNETIYLGGTEPFWSMEVSAGSLTYITPEDPTGQQTAVTRFAGNGGLGVNGTLGGEPLNIAVTPGDCSDGMSDRTYPFTATVELGDEALTGCGHTNSTPYTGEETP